MRKKAARPDGNLAVIYARYSSHSQRDVSIDQQVKVIENFAAGRKLRIVKIYADRAISGTTDNRPQFRQMIEDAKAEAWDYVIVYSLDRFARDRFDSITYKQILKDHGIRVLSAVENISEEPSGILLESVLEGLAEYYSKELSQKIRRGLSDNASKCMVMGIVPFGYTKGKDGKYAIDPVEGPIAQEIFKRVLQKEDYAAIARDLNRRGIRTRKGTEWNKSSFKLLTNERYRGVYIYGDYRIEGGMPALVDDDTFYAVQAEVERRRTPEGSPTKKRRTKAMYLLTGKAYCGKCKAPLVGSSGTGKSGKLFTYYACRNKIQKKCDMNQIPQEKLEWFVAGTLREFVMDDEMMNLLVDISMKAQEDRRAEGEESMLRNRLKDIESRIGNVMKAIEAGIFTPDVKDRLEELGEEKEKLQSQIAVISHNNKLDNLTREEMVALFQLLREGELESEDFQEMIFNMLLNSVYVSEDKITIVLKYKKDGHSTFELPFDPQNIPEVESSSNKQWWSVRLRENGGPLESLNEHIKTTTEIRATVSLIREYAVIELPRAA